MKKSILAIAVAMTLASGSAFALGYNQATAEAGGSIGSMAINNGVSGGYGSTQAGSFSLSGSDVMTRDCSYCGGGAGAVKSGSFAVGGAASVTHGQTFGLAGVQNGSVATFSAESGGAVDAYGNNLEMQADTSAGVAGAAASGIDLGPNESGYAASGTIAGAGSLSGMAGSWRYGEFDYATYSGDMSGLYWDYEKTYHYGEAGEANLYGGSVSAAGSASGGIAENGYAAAGSVAATEGYTQGEVGAEGAFADGAAGSEAGAASGGVIDGTGMGITAAGTVSGATFDAEANRYSHNTDTYEREGYWTWRGFNMTRNEYAGGTDFELNTATVEDNKFTLSGAYTAGTGDIVGGSAAGSDAWVSGYAEAGDVTSDDIDD